MHGTSLRAAFREGRLWVGSHREIKKQHADSVYCGNISRHGSRSSTQ